MKLTLCLLLAGSVCALAATEEKLDRRFTVQPGGTLVVDAEFGSVEVSTNAAPEVVVEVWRKIGRKKKADEEAFLREHPVKFSQDGNTVRIECRGPSAGRFGSGRVHNEAKYTVQVPAQFNARLKSGGGSMGVNDLTGDVNVLTGGGSLSFRRLQGPLHGQTGGGSVNTANCDGTLTLRTGGGSVEVTGGSGSLNGSTGGGSVSVRDFQGPAHMTTGGGGVNAQRVEGEVVASTGGGSVTAVLPSEVAGTVKLSTGGGGITVSVPNTAAFNLDARTSDGSVSSELPVAVVGKIEKGALAGPVNGGGKTVELRSGGGSIHIRKL